MELSPELTQLRLDHAPAERIREAAIAGGMRTMRRDGLDKVAAGITSLSEVVRVAV
jgi:type II secretory ATPase GspE/PulE/Tfp pilus assembly ATPase PilB-like protein